MENKLISIRKKIFTSLVALASFWTISTSKFERDPQNCGMIISQSRRKKSFEEEVE